MENKIKGQIGVRLQGGLGNQLYQYAYGYTIAKKMDMELLLDCQSMDRHQSKNGILDFKLDGIFLNKRTLMSSNRKLNLTKKDFFAKNRFIKMNEMEIRDYQNMELKDSNNIYVDGFFQSAKITEQAFQAGLKLELRKKSYNYLKYMNTSSQHESIGLHVRRGDYLNNENWGILSAEYYSNAIQAIRKRTSESISIFSDDIRSVKEEFLSNEVFKNQVMNDKINWLDGEKKLSAAETLIILSKFDRLIIANSTFSIWAAYISKASHIIGPTTFYRGGEPIFERSNSDWILIPSLWRKI